MIKDDKMTVANGTRQNLPNYETKWVSLGLETQRQENMVIVLFILVSIGKPISCEMIAGMSGKDEYDVKEVLDKWTEYLNQQEIEGDSCYTINHAGFRDFLKGKTASDGKRRLFREVNQQIAKYWEREMGECH